ncbi:MAG: hypothetical protein ABIQ39_00630 [Ilumatobacteraceae bacterium]
MDLPPVSAVADVLAMWGYDGWLTPPLHTLVAPATAVLARATTLRVELAESGPAMNPIYDVLSGDLTGRAVVIAGASGLGGAMWGEILSTAAAASHAAGLLLDGSARDVEAMVAIGMPAYARDRCVVGPRGRAHVVAVEGPVDIGGVHLDPDDLVLLDESGCLRIPAAVAEEALDASRRYAVAEESVIEALHHGAPLTEAYRLKKKVVDQLRR